MIVFCENEECIYNCEGKCGKIAVFLDENGKCDEDE